MRTIEDRRELPEGFAAVRVVIHKKDVVVGLPTDNINQRDNLQRIMDQIADKRNGV